MATKKKSDFGAGFAYPLGLFLAHAERYNDKRTNPLYNASSWFNSAADHLYDFHPPRSCRNSKYAKEIRGWRDKCIRFRLDDSCTWKDVDEAIQYAKDLLFNFDLETHNKPVKGQWE